MWKYLIFNLACSMKFVFFPLYRRYCWSVPMMSASRHWDQGSPSTTNCGWQHAQGSRCSSSEVPLLPQIQHNSPSPISKHQYAIFTAKIIINYNLFLEKKVIFPFLTTQTLYLPILYPRSI